MSLARKRYAIKHGFFNNTFSELAKSASNATNVSNLQAKLTAAAFFLVSLPPTVQASEAEDNSTITTTITTQEKLGDFQKMGIALGCIGAGAILLTIAGCCAGDAKFCDDAINGRRPEEHRRLLV